MSDRLAALERAREDAKQRMRYAAEDFAECFADRRGEMVMARERFNETLDRLRYASEAVALERAVLETVACQQYASLKRDDAEFDEYRYWNGRANMAEIIGRRIHALVPEGHP